MLKLTEFIDDAGEGNGHYLSYLKPELQRLNSFDLRYWPDITGIIRSLGMEEVEITFADEATEAIINAHRPSGTDFFRALFDNISMQKTGDHYGLPRTFKLSDAALATLTIMPWPRVSMACTSAKVAGIPSIEINFLATITAQTNAPPVRPLKTNFPSFFIEFPLSSLVIKLKIPTGYIPEPKSKGGLSPSFLGDMIIEAF
ncbi:hypothetical protein, partial [Klebsiella aerogenes]|uniref:hypothetical protein n=1 Tax=Klebsiella aerogenes TaxID=548 RepID=UPI002FF7E8EB